MSENDQEPHYRPVVGEWKINPTSGLPWRCFCGFSVECAFKNAEDINKHMREDHPAMSMDYLRIPNPGFDK